MLSAADSLMWDALEIGPQWILRETEDVTLAETALRAELRQPAPAVRSAAPAAGHLGGRGIAVSRRAALEHVHDRDVAAALDADALEHLREQLARLADERNALKVLLAAGRLAHERNAHPGTAFGEDDVLAAFGHRAAGACACKPFKRRPVSLFTGGDNFGRKHECGRLRGA